MQRISTSERRRRPPIETIITTFLLLYDVTFCVLFFYSGS